MISTSDDLYSVFLADLSEKERDRVRRYADNFGIEPTDAVWALMIVLGRYSDLYEAVPGKINVTVQGILEKIQSAAAAEAESSRIRLQASLTDAVVGAAESVAARKGLRSQPNTDKKPEIRAEEKLLLSRRDAAQVLSISQRALDYLVATRRLPTRRIGGRVLIPMADLRKYARADHP
jgi:excisionase family DNA binding protein